MANKLLLKKSSVAAKVPLTTDLDYGELALNYADGKLYFKNSSNVIQNFSIGGAGTVTSVSGTGTVSGLTLTGTVTTTGNLTLGGTLAVTASNFASQTANTFLAAPNGTAGVPTFRSLVAADVPTLNQNTTGTSSNVTGTVAILNGGTGGTTNTAARTNLGATTVGSNLFTLANPTAITFLRVNADNTVSTLDAATFRTAIGAGTSSTTGTVTSVSVTPNNGISGTVATSGTTPAISLSIGALTGATSITMNGATSGTVQLLPTAIAGTGTVLTLPATTGTLALTSQLTSGTVTSVAALTIGTTGTDITSTVATGTTTPVITLNVPTASATNRGALSAADWTTFNNKTSNTGTVTSIDTSGTVSGLTLTGGPITTTGTITLGGTLSTSIDNITDEHRIFNNMGDVHGTRASFDATIPSYNFGWRYVQGSTNGPGVNSATQYYSLYVGLGNDYAATGAGSYGMQLAIPRNVTTPYLSIRYNEANSLAAWQKISAGYADSAATATSASNIDGIAFNNSNSTNPVSAPDSLDSNGVGYVTNVSLLGQTDGALYSQAWSSTYQHQIFGDYRTGQMVVRGKNNNVWQAWRTVLDSTNWSSYVTAGGATITDDTATNATRYLLFDDVTTGSASTVGVSSTKLYFNPSTGTLSATNFNSLSDTRLKHNVEQLDQVDALAIIDQLNPVSFQWLGNDQKAYGVIAQEIEQILPEVVETNSDNDIKSVSYMQLVPILIQAIKQLTEQVKELKAGNR